MLIVHRSKTGVAAVLEQWIRNVPTALVERIVADTAVCWAPIWFLASAELDRRRNASLAAA